MWAKLAQCALAVQMLDLHWAGAGTVDPADLRDKTKEIEDTLDPFKFWPVKNLAFVFRFSECFSWWNFLLSSVQVKIAPVGGT